MQANGRRGILRVLRVWSLANGRLERPNNRGLPAKLGVLHAGVARRGLVGVPFPCGAGRTCRGCGAFGTFEAWQMAALNAYKRSHCCGRGVPFPCGGGQTFGGVGKFGGFEASQTAAYKRSHCCGRGVLLSHCGGLVVAFACSVGVARQQTLSTGKQQVATLEQQRLTSKGWRPQSLVEAAARKLPRGALGMDALTTEHYAGKRPARHFKGFKGLKPGKRQAWTP